ncbi:MAG: hypothetical protein PVH63_03790 [Balneolaceae bacterium]
MKTHHYFPRSLTIILSIVVLTTATFIGCTSTGTTEDPHPPVNPGPQFNSGNISPGASFSHTFADEGDIDYYCEIHSPDMQGVIHVDNSASISGQDTVEMKNDQFQPGEVTVTPNTKVVWVNRDQHNHTVVSGNPSSNTGGSGY